MNCLEPTFTKALFTAPHQVEINSCILGGTTKLAKNPAQSRQTERDATPERGDTIVLDHASSRIGLVSVLIGSDRFESQSALSVLAF